MQDRTIVNLDSARPVISDRVQGTRAAIFQLWKVAPDDDASLNEQASDTAPRGKLQVAAEITADEDTGGNDWRTLVEADDFQFWE
jgi:hypothetical protein